jgi:DNA recombination protein RmuC
MSPSVVVLLILNTAVLVLLGWLLRRSRNTNEGQLPGRIEVLDQALSQKFASATADMASRLEQTKGDLRQQMTDRMAQGFTEIRSAVDQQLSDGRHEHSIRIDHFTTVIDGKFENLRASTESRLEGFAEKQAESLRSATSTLEQKFEQLSARQAQGLAEGRTEVAASLALVTAELKREFEGLNRKTEDSLGAIRVQVDDKLLAISNQVQQKLDENIREGFAHFTKVQEHLKAAEEQLRQVGVLGASINDLNSLLKLPHLRGKFGEASLERLLSDFLPSHMYALQASAGGAGRADAMIKFPDRRLPVDAKFPREQVLPLFESSNEEQVAAAREQLKRVMRNEAKRIAAYIEPEQGTMDVALMYLPSETLYVEAIRSTEITDELAKLRVFPVSPNTLLMTLQVIALAYKWYEVAARFEEGRKELARAQKSLGDFQNQFDRLGSSLNKAQLAYDVASKHLKSYRVRVTAISGEDVPELDGEQPALLAKSATEQA